MEITSDSKRYNIVDVLKFVMAILVIAIHTDPLIGVEDSVVTLFGKNILNLAVPFFFLESGFFLGKKLQEESDELSKIKIIKQCRNRLFKLYCIWTAVYLPITIIHFVLEKDGFVRSVLLFIDGFFLLGENYNSWMLWYLLSSIYALSLLVYLIKRTVPFKVIMIISVLILLLGYSIDAFVLMESLPSYLEKVRLLIRYSIVNGRLFRGFFFLPCGIFISKVRLNSKKSIWSFTWLVLFVISWYTTGILKSLLVTIYSVLFVLIVNTVQLRNHRIYAFLRRSSTIVYFIHLYVWTLLYMMIYQEKTYGWCIFILTTITSVIIAFAFILTSEKIGKKKHEII